MDTALLMNQTQWTAAYTLISAGLLFVAILAAVYARQQVEQAKKVHSETTRPYVIVTAEPGRSSRKVFDLVIRNIGQRPAHDVRIKLDPTPVRAKELGGYKLADAKLLAEGIAMIAPGQEIRMFYDSHVERSARSDLPTWHQVNLEYRDGGKGRFTERSVLDLEANKGALQVDEKTLHDLVKAVEGISLKLKS